MGFGCINSVMPRSSIKSPNLTAVLELDLVLYANIRRLCRFPCRRDWLHCELGYAGQTTFSVPRLSYLGLSLIPFSEEGWTSPPALKSPLDLISLKRLISFPR